MATTNEMSIEERLQSLALSEPDAVLFDPTRRSSLRDFRLSPVPRYLFRVFTPHSDGDTDKHWVKSKDVLHRVQTANQDVFETNSMAETAKRIWGHLKWKRLEFDNLMSWTSSLLFAIQYMFYRHITDASPEDGIMLCIVDTNAFDGATFIRDMDLIKTFAAYDQNLHSFEGLRKREYYFGEYLSQGALRVDGKCEIISMKQMIDAGLLQLNEEFQISLQTLSREWARTVLRVRHALDSTLAGQVPPRTEHFQIAIDISKLFGRRFRLPMAINLVAVLPGHMNADMVGRVFKIAEFSEREREQCLPDTFCIVDHQLMPEISRAMIIRDAVCMEHYRSKFNDSMQKAKSSLDMTMQHLRDLLNLGNTMQRQRLGVSMELANRLHSLTGELTSRLVDAFVSDS